MSQPEDSSKFFAFVDFETHEAAVAACTALHEKEIEGCKLYVDRAQTKTERQGILQRRFEQKCTNMAQSADGKNIYIKNLPSSVDEEGLKAAFAVCLCLLFRIVDNVITHNDPCSLEASCRHVERSQV